MITSKPKFTLSAGQALIAEFEQSGLKPGVFCAKKNISYHILKYWRDRCDELNTAAKQSDTKFLPVKILEHIAGSTPLKIILSPRLCVEVPNGADLMHLKQVLEVCRTCG